MKLVFATHNHGKIREMASILADLAIDVVSADEAGVTKDVEEDGSTLEENALKKAKYVAHETHEWVIADDTGLFIDALGGAPGIHSNRWAGEQVKGNKLAEYTLQQMLKIPADKRSGNFTSVVVVVAPGGKHWTFQGKLKGTIAPSPRGTPRPLLPYDTIFIPEGERRTFAEMSESEKNAISHRGRAFEGIKKFLEERLKVDNKDYEVPR